MIRHAAFALLSAGATMASAEMSFDWPVDCVQGETCYIQNYVDRDPGEGWADFTCGALSYDGHKGTDIALPTQAQIADGVAVLAAAPGVVQGKRDGVEDVLYTGQDLGGKDCGNGVVIDHGGGWVTQYCHLRKGSIVVGSGARVEAGQKLGEIGLSGRTQFPHLHLSIRKDGQVVDPFAPGAADGTCNAPDAPDLWALDVAYEAGGLLDVAFTTRVPEYSEVKEGRAASALQKTEPLVLVGFAFGARAGDALQIDISGPGGAVFSHSAEIDRNRAQLFRAGGKRAPDGGWPQGTYQGKVSLVRDGAIIDSREISGRMN